MSAKAVARIAKPQLRGLLTDQIKKHLGASIVLSIAAMMAYKFTVADVRKQVYAEFYRNYDVDKEFEKMRDAGIFTSVLPKED